MKPMRILLSMVFAISCLSIPGQRGRAAASVILTGTLRLMPTDHIVFLPLVGLGN